MGLGNPFDRQLFDLLRGELVRVRSNHGREFVGHLDRVRFDDRHVILRDARDLEAGERTPTAFVAHVDWIRRAGAADDHPIEQADPRQLAPCDYAVGKFDPEENSGYVAEVAERGFVGSYPTVAVQDGDMVVVEGHSRVAAARHAGLEAMPVVVRPLSAVRIATLFAFDHYPLPHHIEDGNERPDGCYDDEAVAESIAAMLRELHDRALGIFPVRWNYHRLDVNRGGAGDR